MSVISITGHRDITRESALRVGDTMRELVQDPDVEEIWFGGALGADTFALRAALHLRKEGRPRLVVVVPDTLDKQPIGARGWILQADALIELQHPLQKSDFFKAYTIRDQYLVDVATSLVAFYDPSRPKSGTGKTVRMAQKRGIPIRIVPVQWAPV